MHEVHIVRDLVSTLEKQASARGAKTVKRVRIKFNRLTSHDAGHVEFSFDLVKKESRLLQDAALDLTEIPPLVRCDQCRHEFEVDELPNVCPRCNSVALTPVNPTEMTVESFEMA
jgi:hydrogenase nickel incorporation protein HypA/HybF